MMATDNLPIMQLPDPDFDVPAVLRGRFEQIRVRVAALDIEIPGVLAPDMLRVLLVSEFALQVLEKYPKTLFQRLLDPMPLSREYLVTTLELENLDEDEAMAQLRRVRNVELARLAWRAIDGKDDVASELTSLSLLADCLIEAAVQYATMVCEKRYEDKYFSEKKPSPLLVLAMGKLGGEELNFSSDVDLILLYPDDDVDAAQVQPFYIRIVQFLVKLLDERTVDGIVYRVDTRLRPFGSSGPLAMGLGAFETYLVRNGRDWERYAYLKARLLSGYEYSDQVFDQVLRPYVYRSYLDYGVIDALRQLKHLIRQEVTRRDMSDNVKLGPGGIREIEFIVQAHQLVRGGADPDLRERVLLNVLPKLVGDRMLSHEVVAKLSAAYLYLRRVENRIQALDDHQAHQLPSDDLNRARLLLSLKLDNWDAFESQLQSHRATVEVTFEDIVAGDLESKSDDAFIAFWEQADFDSKNLPIQFSDIAPLISELQNLRHSQLYLRMSQVSRGRLVAVLEKILERLRAQPEAPQTLRRVLSVIEAICRRSAYLSLLAENPTALDNLLKLANRSARFTSEIATQPVLLDELLDSRIFDEPPTRDEFRGLLRRRLLRIDREDIEASVDAIRQFQAAAVFRTAISDTLGHLPLMKVSDRLTDIAEICIRFALDLAWQELTDKYGVPRSSSGDECGLIVVAYGKLGGYELGYGSDLDLVFIHDSNDSNNTTDGSRAIANDVFFMRLAQRFIHILSIQTAAGVLYEIDTRLRPSGTSGFLVTSIARFERYQRTEAWVWEHQALLRSRAVAGKSTLMLQYDHIRQQVLTENVDRSKLREEIVSMRSKMRANLSTGDSEWFDIKQDSGGLADIEFLIDYLVLKNAPSHGALIDFPDNIRQLKALEAAGMLDAVTAASLSACYLAFRAATHDAALDDRDRRVALDQFTDERQTVQIAWQGIFG